MEVLPTYDVGQKGDLLEVVRLLEQMRVMAGQVNTLLVRHAIPSADDPIYQASCLVPTGAIERTEQWVKVAIGR